MSYMVRSAVQAILIFLHTEQLHAWANVLYNLRALLNA